jgi:hypothetical protein
MIVHVYTLLALVTQFQKHVNFIIYGLVTAFHLVCCGPNYIYHFLVISGLDEVAEQIYLFTNTGDFVFYTSTLLVGALTPIAVTCKIFYTAKKVKTKTLRESAALIIKDKFIVLTLIAQLTIVIGYFVLGYIQAYTLIMQNDANSYAIYALDSLFYCLHSSLSTLSFQHFSKTLQNIKGSGNGGSNPMKKVKKASKSVDNPATIAKSGNPISDN